MKTGSWAHSILFHVQKGARRIAGASLSLPVWAFKHIQQQAAISIVLGFKACFLFLYCPLYFVLLLLLQRFFALYVFVRFGKQSDTTSPQLHMPDVHFRLGVVFIDVLVSPSSDEWFDASKLNLFAIPRTLMDSTLDAATEIWATVAKTFFLRLGHFSRPFFSSCSMARFASWAHRRFATLLEQRRSKSLGFTWLLLAPNALRYFLFAFLPVELPQHWFLNPVVAFLGWCDQADLTLLLRRLSMFDTLLFLYAKKFVQNTRSRKNFRADIMYETETCVAL